MFEVELPSLESEATLFFNKTAAYRATYAKIKDNGSQIQPIISVGLKY